ncbi:MAG: NirA family protein, partial [Gluconacetobacter diazotrophicus]|nr:NirA family protein [Gluconacetobacter diazotrophicus]
MSSPVPPRYLDGLLAATRPRRGVPPPAAPRSEEERIKRALHPLDAFGRLLDCAEQDRPPDGDDAFRFQWFGLFYQGPRQDAFTLRLRLPGGRLRAFQLAGLAEL